MRWVLIIVLFGLAPTARAASCADLAKWYAPAFLDG